MRLFILKSLIFKKNSSIFKSLSVLFFKIENKLFLFLMVVIKLYFNYMYYE